MFPHLIRLFQRGKPGVLAFALAATGWLWTGAAPAAAQTLPKTIEPQRFDQRFQMPEAPRSEFPPAEVEEAPPAPAEELKEMRFRLRRVIVEGATRFSGRQLAFAYRRFLNREVSVADVYRIARALTVKYRNAGYILSRAVVPPQKIGEQGEVRIRVVEGFIDQVGFHGERHGPMKLLKSFRNAILRSRPLRMQVLERYLLLLNDLPGVNARSVLTPSKTTAGASDLLIILEHKEVDAYAGLDNRGSRFNGPFQMSAGASWNSGLGLYERTGIQAVTAADFQELLFLNLHHELPVSIEGTRLRLSGTHSRSEPGDILAPFQIEGTSNLVAVALSHPFLRTRTENLSASLGFAFKDSQTDILNATVFKDKLRVLDLAATYDHSDRYKGINVVSVRLSQGLDIFGSTEAGSPGLSRPQGKSDFTKIEGELLRLQQLGPGLNLLGSLAWQYSFSNLLAAEEFIVGGPRYGRAYDSSEISGDSGLAAKLELQYGRSLDRGFLRDYQWYLYGDFGSVWNRLDPNNAVIQEDLFSAGTGVRFNLTPELSGYLELTVPLSRRVAAEGDRDPRLFFGVIARY